MYVKSLSAAACALLVTLASAAPRSHPHVVHEARSTAPQGWTKRERVDGRAVLPLRIGLKQRNLDRANELLDSVSNPKSANYAKYWSAKEVADMFAPSEESIAEVMSWLVGVDIDTSRISVSPSKSWVSVTDATVKEMESLMHTEYHVYEHESGQLHVAAESYKLPEHLSAEHVDLVMPSVHFDVKLTSGSEELRRRKKREVEPGVGKKVASLNVVQPKVGKQMSIAEVNADLSKCDTLITPPCLRALYSVPENTTAAANNSYGIVEYTPQAYVASDLDIFFKNFSKAQVGTRPILASIDGGDPADFGEDLDSNVESNLDLEYAMALVYPQKVTLYQVGDAVEGASFNNFLDALDASYCTYEGGDDKTQDATYPDPSRGGYKGAQACGTFTSTNVISTSYGYNEADLTPTYEQRQCNEYMKLGLQGVSVLYSSGDYGVAGNGGQCLNADGTFNDGTSGRFNPSFPGTCPYVTSVGATQVPTGTDVGKALASGTQPETACETVIYSGGGFSNVFAMPSYQSSAVSTFLTEHKPSYGSDRFNNTGTVRAIPDVSANGANYAVAVDGKYYQVYGTSASSPVFGSLITLINGERLKAGKGPVGFLNPTFYANPDIFYDVTSGGNQGCGTNGFEATTGWDPVTGLGTPNYPKMLALFLSLP